MYSVLAIQSTKYQSVLQSTSTGNKMKTKIPVYLNQSPKPNHVAKQQTQHINNNESPKRTNQSNKTLAPSSNSVRNKAPVERKVPGSLMNATKSSSAKIVTKTTKEKQTKATPKAKAPLKHTSRQEVHEQTTEIPLMQRSGTFLKDEPTFGEITTNIDVDQ